MTTDFPFTDAQEEWLAALESGDYRQAREWLSLMDGETGEQTFCCLGLGCHLYDESRWKRRQSGFVLALMFENQDKGLPFEVRTRLGLADRGGTIRHGDVGTEHPDDMRLHDWLKTKRQEFGDGVTLSLAEMNDARWTFAEIAAFIRRNPHAVFWSFSDEE